ncbi:hypothetical protein OBBRIDRAFT_428875 [Obba rivulosa]|uniref:Uncharacterized protein n=1 Tax=Obba rivulosa TaxID=1052685 RepID=A0A8E2B2C0_9APHY|nr:hypothetical protein OBBRIDRAFT_428875 [Obba rivulosa]
MQSLWPLRLSRLRFASDVRSREAAMMCCARAAHLRPDWGPDLRAKNAIIVMGRCPRFFVPEPIHKTRSAVPKPGWIERRCRKTSSSDTLREKKLQLERTSFYPCAAASPRCVRGKWSWTRQAGIVLRTGEAPAYSWRGAGGQGTRYRR